ncbi:MAG: CPBP family intramembrane metalloprotease [Vulcanococcus sp.]|jgi:membrane protease YdiL (CAAX protease family)|uniref:CPBP family intramembrane glutamic endopeptidase n=1 Tax=Vulcanococcus sp. TaxID=2856995 RepID=UPI0025D758D6|nr:type II CAAX endopeptidase family protein [Vulcanococcus sp.]MBW0180802.1 CPBP family intramembrane metalloprotease [Vulcanococcus sp.]
MPRLNWWGTVLYPAALVAVFLGGQLLLKALGVPGALQASLAALPAVAALLISLPVRLRRCWAEAKPWQRLGVLGSQEAVTKALLRGVLKAIVLLALVITALALSGELSWMPQLNTGLLLNAVALGLGVGFAEELLFRGWLFGELSLLLGPQRALWLQAALFSLVHTRFNLPPIQLVGLLVGLVLLGLALGLQRRADGGLLWGAIGLHGGLVAGWFVLHQGLVAINPSAPAWLMGPDNPIGGVIGWLGLALLLLARRPWWNEGTRTTTP